MTRSGTCRARRRLDSLEREAAGDASLARELAAAFERIGDVQGQPREANLGDQPGAATSYRKALAIRERLAAHDPNDVAVRRELVPNYGKLSDLLWAMGDNRGAIETSRKGLAAAEAILAAAPGDRANRVLLAMCRIDHGYKQASVEGALREGLATLRRGTDMLEQLASDEPRNLRLRRVLGVSYSRMAGLLREDPSARAEALALYGKAIAAKEALVALEPSNSEFRRLVAYDRFETGEVRADMGDLPAALADDRVALTALEDLARVDPANAQLQQDLGSVRGHIGQILARSGHPAEAIDALRSSIASVEKTPGAHDPRLDAGETIANDQYWIAKAHLLLASSARLSPRERREHCRDARSWFERCLPAFELLRKGEGADSGSAAARVEDIHRNIARGTRCGST